MSPVVRAHPFGEIGQQLAGVDVSDQAATGDPLREQSGAGGGERKHTRLGNGQAPDWEYVGLTRWEAEDRAVGGADQELVVLPVEH